MFANLYYSVQFHCNYIPQWRAYATKAGAYNNRGWGSYSRRDIYIKTINLDKKHHTIDIVQRGYPNFKEIRFDSHE